MGFEQTSAPVYSFTCDACHEEMAESSTIPPDGWDVLNTGTVTNMVGPVCLGTGVVLEWDKKAEGWVLARPA